MIRHFTRLLIVLSFMDATYNAIWTACANTPATPLFTALALAALLMLLLGQLERVALACPTRRTP